MRCNIFSERKGKQLSDLDFYCLTHSLTHSAKSRKVRKSESGNMGKMESGILGAWVSE